MIELPAALASETEKQAFRRVEPLLVLLAVAAAVNAFGASPDEPDGAALGMYVGLALTLAALSRIHVPVATP